MISNLLSASQIVASDVFVGSGERKTREAHLQSAVDWLKRAHDASTDGGVSYGYCLRGPNLQKVMDVGWRRSYVETSGYILETFYDLGARFDDHDAGQRAEQVARWLLTVQLDDGSFSNEQFTEGQGIVFDTGQVLFGLVRAFKETGDTEFLDAARRAASWLVDRLDEDGAWRKNTHQDCVHTYNSRVAWAMLELDAIDPDATVRNTAAKNLAWSADQATGGFFENCAFKPNVPPFTHTIAYAIRGIFEGGLLLEDENLLTVARNSATAMLAYVDERGHIPGRIDVDGTPKSKSCCLTGNCQMAIIWLKMNKLWNIPEMQQAAKRAMDFVMSAQDLVTNDENVRGAIKGSQPIWGHYAPLSYPNWATKFFIEAMLLLED